MSSNRSTGSGVGSLAGPAQQVALAGVEAQLEHGLEQVRRLDALGDDRPAALAGDGAERAQDRLGRLVVGAGPDQREVDLHDVEVDLAQQAQAGVAGPDVVDRDADVVPAQGRDGGLQAASGPRSPRAR